MEETQTQQPAQLAKPQMAGLPLGLVQDILAYLGNKPFVEVDAYIRAINDNVKIINLVEVAEK